MKTLTNALPGIRALDWNEETKCLLIGTRGCEIYEVGADSEDMPKQFMWGHYNGEVWGCAVNPKDQTFVSCGGDKTL